VLIGAAALALAAVPGVARAFGRPTTPTVPACRGDHAQVQACDRAILEQRLAQNEWLRTQTPRVIVSKVVAGQTVSVITYPTALKKGLTCEDLRVDMVTMGPGCVVTKGLFASAAFWLHEGQYNGGVDLGLTYVWGAASAQIKKVEIRTASGNTVTVPVVDGAFLYAGVSGAAPVSATAKNADGRTVSAGAVPNFSQQLQTAKSHHDAAV